MTLIERSWSSTYQEVLTQPHFHHLAIRYVDSFFVIVQKHHLQAPVFKVFTDLDFYGSPVEMELVADNFTSRLLCWCFWKNNHFSRNPPIAFERTEESSSFNSQIFISVLSSTEFVARTISVFRQIPAAIDLLWVGSTPVSKGFANFSVFQFFNFSVLRQGVDPRVQRTHFFTALGVVWAPNQGRWNRKSDFSNTFELGRDAYREIVEQYLSRSSDSTKFSSSCNQVRRQPFCHCTEAPSSSSSVQSVYRLGLLW